MKSKTQNATIQNDFPKINCHYHKEELLRYFCKKSECLQPLCKVCLNIHMDEHEVKGDTKDVCYFEKCIQEVQRKMALEQYNLATRIEEFENEITRFINFKCEQNWFSLIEQAESQALEIVQSYFRNIKSYLISEYPSIHKLEIARDSIENFRVRQEQLRSEILNLNNQNAVAQLILYYQGDVQKLNKKYTDQLEQMINDFNDIDFSSIAVPQFKIKHEMTTKLYDLLGQYAYFEQMEVEEQSQSQQSQGEEKHDSNEQSAKENENEEMEYY